MKALTVWQPWASVIFLEGKDVENRSWATSYRGPLAIHAGRWVDEAYAAGEDLPRGVVLGVVDLVSCVREAASPWAVPGQWHWVLANPRRFPRPIPARGRPGLWEWEPPSRGRAAEEGWPRMVSSGLGREAER